MKITKQRRKEIEKLWVSNSEGYFKGCTLCNFIDRYVIELEDAWNNIWCTQENGLISTHYLNYYYGDDLSNLSYLCRALSLNMLLDDNS